MTLLALLAQASMSPPTTTTAPATTTTTTTVASPAADPARVGPRHIHAIGKGNTLAVGSSYPYSQWASPSSFTGSYTVRRAGTGVRVRMLLGASVNCALGIGLRVGGTTYGLTLGGVHTLTPTGVARLVDFDPLPTLALAVGDVVQIVSAQNPGVGQHFANGGAAEALWSNTGVDLSTSGSAAPSNPVGAAPFTAPWTLTVGGSSSTAVLGLGDSVMAGFGAPAGCYLERAAVPIGMPFANVAVYGEALSQPDWSLRLGIDGRVLDTVTDVLVAYGANELNSAVTGMSHAQAVVNFVRARLYGHGVRRWVGTVTPRTTSTDSWATTAGQTPVAIYTARRAEYNAWLRDGAPVSPTDAATVMATGSAGALRIGQSAHPFSGVVDIDGAVAVGDVWAAGKADDGVHPNDAGVSSILGIVTPWMQGLT